MHGNITIIKRGLLLSIALIIASLFLMWKSSPVEGLAWNPPDFRTLRNDGDDLAAACPAISGLSGKVTGISSIDDSFIVSTRSPNALWIVSNQYIAKHLTSFSAAPTAMAVVTHDSVIVGLEEKGVFRLSLPDLSLHHLTINGVPEIRFPSAIAVAKDGTYALAEGSRIFRNGWPLDFLDGRANGRLFTGHAGTDDLQKVDGDFYYISDLSFHDNSESLLITETFRYRVRKLVRTTNDQYKEEPPLFSNLPIMPYSIQRFGPHWYLSGSLRNTSLDAVQRSSVLRRIAASAPYELLKSLPTRESTRHALIAKAEPQGMRMVYQNFGGSIYGLSVFKFTNDALLFGSFYLPGLRVAKLGPDGQIYPCANSLQAATKSSTQDRSLDPVS